MKIRKFIASGMQEAVAQVKRELGPDAMIVSTRQVRRGLIGNGVEVTAAVDVDEGAEEPSTPQPQRGPGLSDADIDRVILPLRSELRSLRSMLRPIGERALEEELRSELQAIRQALSGLVPSGGAEAPLSEVAARAPIAAPSQRQMVALIGPTGVGKTTTIAKLAARSALIEKRSVAIVTLDTYRVGGEEQLRAFADLMGVPLTLVSDADQVAPTLRRLAGAHDRIYIDTAGRSPRDQAAILQLERSLAGVENLEVHLALAAGTAPAAADQWSRRLARVGVDRLLFTKVDEAFDLAELVRAPARLARPISFITTGQRVPEDLEDASTARLLDLASRGFAQAELAA